MFSLSNILSFVAGIWISLLILMIIHDDTSKKVVLRRNLQWLFIATSAVGLILFLVLFVPAIQIVVLQVQTWVWILLGATLLGAVISFFLWRHYHGKTEESVSQ